ncbi:unnamed protein product, partial [marine sediment metagenome]
TGYINRHQCLITGNLGLLMGIYEGGCEGSKEEKKIQSLQFFLIFFWLVDTDDRDRGRFASRPFNTGLSVLYVYTNPGGNIGSFWIMNGFNQ